MNIKTFLLVCFLLTFFNIATFGQAKDKIAKVVIDAGHGGQQPGAVGKLSKEKEINLKVALRVGELISQNLDDVTVLYTRKKDETVELYKRAQIANKNKADLFISIHCNSAETKTATGVETFVMGIGKTAESIAVAKKENADILLEKDYETNYSGFDPNSPEAYIIFSLYSSAYLNNSTLLASKVQKHLIHNTKLVDRNVRQGSLFVLHQVAMPSILIELGFISNAEEEKFLLQEENQEVMAISIYNAFVEYKNLIEGNSKPFLAVPNAKRPMVVSENQNPSQPEIVSQIENLPDSAETTLSVEPSEVEKPVQPETITNNICFRIQFFTSKDNIGTANKKFSSLSDVKKYHENGVWKYTSGDFKTLEEVQPMLKEVKKHYADAFIIAFHNERKIPITEALELLK
ncbi:MAG: N-acetylmuramoyl-L-alanine amidase [Lentimicrobiaceae bacterium]|nr:N-acetylmuramoyl-L-alanine amidase [Lentimicrobiaceae bacterium]